jgi:DNA-binding transcriptional MerR regulator
VTPADPAPSDFIHSGYILMLKVVKRLLDAGISLQQIRTAIDHLRERGSGPLTGHP